MKNPPPVIKSCSILDVQEENIPNTLKNRKQWVCWKGEPTKEGKLTKVPKNPRNGYNASHSSPAHWDTYENAIQAYRKNPDGYSGIGYVFSKDCPFCGVDLDNCRDPKTGKIEKWAEDILSDLSSYAEVSPSGTGIKVFIKAKLPGKGRKKDQIEVYDKTRFFTMTGHTVNGLWRKPQARQEAIDKLCKKHFPLEDGGQKVAPPPDKAHGANPPEPSPDPEREVRVGDIVLRAGAEPPTELFAVMMELDQKFKATWMVQRDDLQDKSQSAHDLALVTLAAIAGWKAQEIADLIIAFRRKTGNQPEKALRADYMLVGEYALIPKAMKAAQKYKPAREIAEQAIQQNDTKLVHSNSSAEKLAQLPHESYLELRAKLKAHFGNALGVVLLDKRVKRARQEKVRATSEQKIEKDAKEAGLPIIQVADRQLADLESQAIDALRAANATNPTTFERAGDLVRIKQDEDGRYFIKKFCEITTRRALSHCALFVKESRDGPVNVPPPRELAQTVLVSDTWGVPRLRGISETPIIRQDGTCFYGPGYDPATQFYCGWMGGNLDLPESPSQNDAKEAMEFLQKELFFDIPFVDQASQTNAMAAYLTPGIRQILAGEPVPAALIDAPVMGSGKSLIPEAVALTYTGRTASMLGYPDSENEIEKVLVSVLIDGSPLLIIDNVEKPVKSAHLSRAISSRTYRGRLLGVNVALDLPIHFSPFITGNNLRIGGDMPRRCYWLRIDPEMPRPWLRDETKFRHPDLLSWISTHRTELVEKVFIIVTGWIKAGKPPARNPKRIGGFRGWCDVMGGILQFAGLSGFLGNLQEMYSRIDEETEQWEAFLLLWLEYFGSHPITANEVYKNLTDATYENVFTHHAPDSLMDVIEGDPRTATKRMGKALSKVERRRYGDRQLYLKKKAGFDSKNKAAGWMVLEG